MEQNKRISVYEESCDFPSQLLDEKVEYEEDEMLQFKEGLDHSPRTLKYLDRFDLNPGEKLVKTYTCALQKRILLQGRIYITTKKICFHSILNDKTLIFGKPTKVVISYEEIDEIRKCLTACLFRNAIEITTKDGETIRFASLLKRTKVHKIITRLMKQDAKLSQDLLKDSFISSNPESKSDSSSKGSKGSDIDVEIEKKDNPKDTKPTSLFNNKYIEKLSQLDTEEDCELERLDDEFEEDNLKEYIKIHEDTYKNIDIMTFYNKVYGDYIYLNGETFLYNYLEKGGNSDIEIGERNPKMPEYFPDSEHKISTITASYTHPINQPLCPPTCDVKETHSSFFVSPKKIIILKKVENSGFTYSNCFMPIYMITLEQLINPVKKTFSVKQTVQCRVKFLKTVRLFKGKIRSKAEAEMDANTNDILIPLIKACLTKHEKEQKKLNMKQLL